MRTRLLTAGVVLALSGCVWDNTAKYGPKEVVRSKPSPVTVPANLEASSRVDSMGRRILAANPSIAAKPIFQTIGMPHPELFHQGTTFIYITQGLVQRCQTDGELAAVLCYELAKMVAERESLAPLSVKRREVLPPMDPGLTKDVIGAQTEPDQFRLAELAKYEKERENQPAVPTLIDPLKLARTYLEATGFEADELDRAKPHLDAAASHYELEGQITGANMPAPFAPRR